MARTVIIGDVHSCADELSSLLDSVQATSSDRIFLVGDFLSRGPDPHGVLRILREVGARSAVGNHEQRLIDAHRARLGGQKGPRLGPSHQAIVEELTDRDWEFLESLPLMLPLPEHNVVIAHAGVVPGIPLTQQDPWMVTHIRSVDDGKPTEKWGTPWASHYGGPEHIVFGHNARKSPQIHSYATGLDTGCVYGGALTALILDEGEPPPPVSSRAASLRSVPARKQYSDYGRALS